MELLGIIVYTLFGILLTVYFILLALTAIAWSGDWRYTLYALPSLLGIAIEYHVFTELIAVGIK